MIVELSEFFNNPSLINIGFIKIQYYAVTWVLSAVFIFQYLKNHAIIKELEVLNSYFPETNKLIIGNKMDLLEGDAPSFEAKYDLLTSAKTGENVEGAFLDLAKLINNEQG